MGLTQIMQKQLRRLQEAHDRRVKAAEERAKRQLEAARTKTAREKVRLQLQREKMAAKKELYEAQVATKKAKLATEKARKEAGDLTIGERLGRLGRELGRGSVQAYKTLAVPPKTSRRKRIRR